jgi:hypothetical protein
MIEDVTKNVAPTVKEFNLNPSDETLMAILNYSKSIEVVEIENQKILLNLN